MALFKKPEGYDAVMEAARQAREAHIINRFEFLRLELFVRRPKNCAWLLERLTVEAGNRGIKIPLKGNKADWTQLIAFIKELIPLIMELIKLFS